MSFESYCSELKEIVEKDEMPGGVPTERIQTIMIHLSEFLWISERYEHFEYYVFDRACFLGRRRLVKHLMNYPCESIPLSNDGVLRGLWTSMYNKRKRQLKLLLSYPQVTQCYSIDRMFHCAVTSGETKMVQIFLRSGKVSCDGLANGLREAVGRGYTKIIHLLVILDHVDFSWRGNYALRTAIRKRNSMHIRILLQNKSIFTAYCNGIGFMYYPKIVLKVGRYWKLYAQFQSIVNEINGLSDEVDVLNTYPFAQLPCELIGIVRNFLVRKLPIFTHFQRKDT